MKPQKWRILAYYLLGILPFLIGDDLFAAYSISVSSSPSLLLINTAVAGADPTDAVNDTTTYAVSTDSTRIRKVRAKISSALPSGLSLSIAMDVPSGASSLGSRAMTTAYQDLVTGIPKFTTASGMTITYTLSATAAVAPASGSRTVTFSIH